MCNFLILKICMIPCISVFFFFVQITESCQLPFEILKKEFIHKNIDEKISNLKRFDSENRIRYDNASIRAEITKVDRGQTIDEAVEGLIYSANGSSIKDFIIFYYDLIEQ